MPTKPLVVWSLISCVAASGCCSHTPIIQNRVSFQEDAGQARISVVAVKRWSEYRDALQPKFSMDGGDAALSQVLPETARYQQTIRDAIRAELKAALPTSLTTSTITTALAADGTKSTTGSSQTATAPGDVTKVSLPTAPTNESAALLVPTDFMNKALGQDPMLRYLAATALFQEVQLLNTYVKDAAIAKDFEPYIVRLQIGLVPRQRYEPYDVRTTISAFAPRDPNKSEAASGIRMAVASRIAKQKDDKEVRILPLLVTDNIESVLASRNSQQVRELGFGLLATLSGIGASAGASSAFERLESVLSRDYNSLFMITRLSDNSVRVRLGAEQIGPDAYSMTTRSHNVTLLVLVPLKDHKRVYDSVEITAKSICVDASTGTELECKGDDALLRDVADTLSISPAKFAENYELITSLVHFVKTTQWGAFNATLDKLKTASRDERNIWADIVDLCANERFTSVGVELPESPPDPSFAIGQTPILVDDGTDAATLELTNARNIDRVIDRLVVSLQDAEDRNPSAPKLKIGPRSFGLSGDGRKLTIVFPSLKVRNLDPKNSATDHLYVDIGYTADDKLNWIGARTEVLYRIVPPVPPKPAVTALLDVTRVVPDAKGQALLRVFLKAGESYDKTREVALRLIDARIQADLVTANKVPIAQAEDRWVVKQLGTLDLPIGEMKEAKQMQLILMYDGKQVGDPMKVDVAVPKTP